MKSILLLIICFLFATKMISQNVGIGITIPTAKLHVNGPVKLEGLNLFEFGAGVAGKEINAGKIGYNAFGTNALAFVGGGTSTLNRAVYFFAEGGSTFTGPVNIGGTISVNGNPGATGQVLTSNGSSDPQWKNASFANTTRFSVEFNTGGYNTSIPFVQRYNLNPTDITIGTNSITINKTGLYHFDGFFFMSATYSASYIQAFAPIVTLYIATPADLYYYTDSHEMALKTYYISTNPVYSYQQKFSYDIHLTSGTTIALGRIFVGQLTNVSFSNRGNFSGYLISE